MLDDYNGNGTPKLLLSACDAANVLSVCARTLWSNTAPRGTIPVVRIGNRVLYAVADLTAWIDGQRVAR